MTIPIFIGFAAVVFVIGVLFVVRGISSEEQEAVPISNPQEIQALKNVYVPPKEPASAIRPQSARLVQDQDQSNRMREENQQLRKQIDEQRVRFEQLEKDLDALKKEYTERHDQRVEKLKNLEEEKARFDREKEQLLSKGELLSELKVKIEVLEKQYDEVQKQRSEMNTVIVQLKAEKDNLLMQTKLKEEQVAIQLREQKAEAGRIEFEALSSKLVESINIIENLKRENKDLQQTNQDLRDEFKEVKEMNGHLVKKEKMIQYELTKNRAQALGLEKICEDFRTQIETMAAAASG